MMNRIDVRKIMQIYARGGCPYFWLSRLDGQQATYQIALHFKIFMISLAIKYHFCDEKFHTFEL